MSVLFSSVSCRRRLLRLRARRTSPAAAALLLLLLAAGCASPPTTPAVTPLARYRPVVEGRAPWEWSKQLGEAVPTPPPPPAGVAGAGAATHTAAVTPPTDRVVRAGRILKRGDRVTISLRGIRNPEDINEAVDDVGAVTLPLVRAIKVEGLTTSEAEERIRSAYIDNGYYSKIDIIVVAQDVEFYVRGEVKREGSYPVAGDLTLLQAIALAGGYTDYAKTSQIKVIRKGSEHAVYDARRIERDRSADPLIKAGDLIVVPRRIIF